MAKLGVRVPPGLTIPTTVCQAFYAGGRNALPDWLMPAVFSALEKQIEPAAGGGRKFGSAENPLLLSVRSGAALSMPGMMDTVLDLGLNDEIVEGLAKRTNERFAYDWCVVVFVRDFGFALREGRERAACVAFSFFFLSGKVRQRRSFLFRPPWSSRLTRTRPSDYPNSTDPPLPRPKKTATAACGRCTATWCSASTTRCSRMSSPP